MCQSFCSKVGEGSLSRGTPPSRQRTNSGQRSLQTETPSRQRPPLARDPPLNREPLLDRDTPLDKDPSGERPPPRQRPPVTHISSSGSHCRGRYPSYWNAFLFLIFYCIYYMVTFHFMSFEFNLKMFVEVKFVMQLTFTCVTILFSVHQTLCQQVKKFKGNFLC